MTGGLRLDDTAPQTLEKPKSTMSQPPMSFQHRHVGRRESMGGGTKQLNPICDGP